MPADDKSEGVRMRRKDRIAWVAIFVGWVLLAGVNYFQADNNWYQALWLIVAITYSVLVICLLTGRRIARSAPPPVRNSVRSKSEAALSSSQLDALNADGKLEAAAYSDDREWFGELCRSGDGIKLALRGEVCEQQLHFNSLQEVAEYLRANTVLRLGDFGECRTSKTGPAAS